MEIDNLQLKLSSKKSFLYSRVERIGREININQR